MFCRLKTLSTFVQRLQTLTKNDMKQSQIDILSGIAFKNGFEQYGSFNEGEDGQHDIFTCLKGRYDGEVIDIYWDYSNGQVLKVEYSCQTKGQTPTFSFNRFWDAKPVLP